MSIKEKIEQRLRDLKGVGQTGDQEKRAALIETTAADLVLRDLLLAAEIANAVAVRAAHDTVVEPTIEDVLAINHTYQSYITSAYQILISRGELPPPPVATTPSSSVTSKADLAS